MNFVFNEGNLDFFKKQYDQAMKDEGWYGVRKLSWHMISVESVWMTTVLWEPV